MIGNYEIVFDKVTKVYFRADKNLVGIKDFDLSIKTNEFVCLIGPSGCGKSTIINLAAGYIFCDTGRITYQEKKIHKPSAERAVVFQEDAIFPWMTVAQNIGYGRQLKKFPYKKQREIIDKYINLVGLQEHADFFPKQLSGGMKKRVDLARAYANNPTTLLMDEPFGSLDIFTRKKMQQLLLELCESENKTVLFVTHDIEEAIFLGDSIIVMTSSPGKVLDKIEVPFSRPRERKIVRSNEFLKLKYQLERMITIGESQQSSKH